MKFSLNIIVVDFRYFLCSVEAVLYGERDDDFIFEDFARLRLKGHEGDDTEAWKYLVAILFSTCSGRCKWYVYIYQARISAWYWTQRWRWYAFNVLNSARSFMSSVLCVIRLFSSSIIAEIRRHVPVNQCCDFSNNRELLHINWNTSSFVYINCL